MYVGGRGEYDLSAWSTLSRSQPLPSGTLEEGCCGLSGDPGKDALLLTLEAKARGQGTVMGGQGEKIS